MLDLIGLDGKLPYFTYQPHACVQHTELDEKVNEIWVSCTRPYLPHVHIRSDKIETRLMPDTYSAGYDDLLFEAIPSTHHISLFHSVDCRISSRT